MQTTETQIRAEIEPPPPRMAGLPIFRGYPVPWFVAWLVGENGEKYPEFRCIDTPKWGQAVREKLCWVCGWPLGTRLAFVAGPMCGINRTSGEPPAHLECARYSAHNCPFLSKPQMSRRENDLPEERHANPHMIARNPGLTLVWITRTYSLFQAGPNEVLIEMGPAEAVEWYKLGRTATRAEVEAAVAAGFPQLVEKCRNDDDRAELKRLRGELEKLYPR